MEPQSTTHLEAPGVIEPHPPVPPAQPRRSSLTPSSRRERPPLRSSPLAGPSYAADGVGNVIQHGSALDEEIARRKSQLHAGLNDEELARLAALSDSTIPMPSTPLTSTSTDALPSSKGSSDASDHSLNLPPIRRARPSFISLAPPSPGATSPGPHSPSSQPSSPPPQTLRSRHSSPNMARTASLPNVAPAPFPPRDHVTDKPAGHWMAAAPSSGFSRNAIHSAGVVLPVKASSRSGQRIRRKSLPAKTSHGSSKPGSPTSKSTTKPPSPTSTGGRQEGGPQTLSPKRSLRSMKSLKSISRMFRADEEQSQPAHQDLIPPVPALPSPLPRSRASSISTGGPPTPTLLSAPSSPRAAKPGHLHILNPNASLSKLSIDEPNVVHPEPGVDAIGKEAGGGRVRKLWAKVMGSAKKRDRA